MNTWKYLRNELNWKSCFNKSSHKAQSWRLISFKGNTLIYNSLLKYWKSWYCHWSFYGSRWTALLPQLNNSHILCIPFSWYNIFIVTFSIVEINSRQLLVIVTSSIFRKCKHKHNRYFLYIMKLPYLELVIFKWSSSSHVIFPLQYFLMIADLFDVTPLNFGNASNTIEWLLEGPWKPLLYVTHSASYTKEISQNNSSLSGVGICQTHKKVAVLVMSETFRIESKNDFFSNVFNLCQWEKLWQYRYQY